MKLALGTRFFAKSTENFKIIEPFLKRVNHLFDKIFVVVNLQDDRSGAYEYIRKLNLPKTEVYGMTFWEKFTPALNNIVYNATRTGCTHLINCSPEIDLTEGLIAELKLKMDDDTLVAGAKLAGHNFELGEHEARGDNVPWNTLAMWDLKYLSRTGFALVADSPQNPKDAGVEELPTIAVLQKLYPNLKAKLVNIGEVGWGIGKLDEERIAAHMEKLETKIQRAEKHLKMLQLPTPKVIHVEVDRVPI